MAASTYQVIALAIYFVAMIAIGLWANSKNNSLDDYVLGGRQLSPTVAALSAGASDMSGWLLMGLPGAVYLSGLSQAWLAVGLTIGAWCNWTFVAPRLRSYTEVAGDAVTVPVFLSCLLYTSPRHAHRSIRARFADSCRYAACCRVSGIPQRTSCVRYCRRR